MGTYLSGFLEEDLCVFADTPCTERRILDVNQKGLYNRCVTALP